MFYKTGAHVDFAHQIKKKKKQASKFFCNFLINILRVFINIE